MVLQNLNDIGSCNGLLPEGTEPLPEPTLTNHKLGLVAVISKVNSHAMLKISILDFENYQ